MYYIYPRGSCGIHKYSILALSIATPCQLPPSLHTPQLTTSGSIGSEPGHLRIGLNLQPFAQDDSLTQKETSYHPPSASSNFQHPFPRSHQKRAVSSPGVVESFLRQCSPQ